MLQGVVRAHSRIRIVVQHPQNEVLEFQVVRHAVAGFAVPPATRTARLHAQDVVELPRAWQFVFSLVLRLLEHVAPVRRQLVKVLACFVRLIEYVFRRHAQHLDNLVHLIDFVGAAEERLARVHLHENAAERPHVDGQVVRDAQQDFRRAIEARLDVLVYL